MKSYPLDTILSGHVYAFVFIFSRIGSTLMLFPGIGESYVPPRMRLMFAFLVSFLLTEPLLSRIPAMPSNIASLVGTIGYEVLVGLFYGTFLRLLMGVLETTGSIIGIQTGLSNATVLNPTLGVQSALPSALLSTTGLVLLFITGLDHVLLRGMVATYDLFPPGGAYLPGDMAQTIIHEVNRSFLTGIELAMPFVVIGLLMFAALGLMQRIMTQVQLFLVILPIQIWGGLILLSLTITGILTVWLAYINNALVTLFAG